MSRWVIERLNGLGLGYRNNDIVGERFWLTCSNILLITHTYSYKCFNLNAVYRRVEHVRFVGNKSTSLRIISTAFLI